MLKGRAKACGLEVVVPVETGPCLYQKSNWATGGDENLMLIIWFEVFLFGSLLYVTEIDTVRLHEDY